MIISFRWQTKNFSTVSSIEDVGAVVEIEYDTVGVLEATDFVEIRYDDGNGVVLSADATYELGPGMPWLGEPVARYRSTIFIPAQKFLLFINLRVNTPDGSTEIELLRLRHVLSLQAFGENTCFQQRPNTTLDGSDYQGMKANTSSGRQCKVGTWALNLPFNRLVVSSLTGT